MTGIQECREQASPGVLVELYELDATALGGSLYRFCNSALEADLVRFGGDVYAPAAFESSGWAVTSDGSIPRPTIRIASAPTLLAAVVSLKDLRGALVRRIRTFRQFLDDGETPDPAQRLPADIYIVNRVVSRDVVAIEFELVPILDQEGKQIPSRQCFRTVCGFVYRRYSQAAPAADPFDYTTATCPYAGSSYFTRLGDSTADPASDRCGKHLTDCKLRFGDGNPLPFGGFPGMVRI